MDNFRGYDRLVVEFKAGACHSNCAFCHAGDEYKQVFSAPFDKILAIADKLLAWRGECAPRLPLLFTTGTWDHPFVAEALKLRRRSTNGPDGCIMLGGMRHRSESEMAEWLREARSAGADRLGVTFWGSPEMHDRWCGGKKGEYDFTMMAARLAPEASLTRGESILLTKSGLPHLDELLDQLDRLPGPCERVVFPLNYMGRGKNLESERLTTREFEKLPDRITRHLRGESLRTEKDWMAVIMGSWSERQATRVLRISIDRATVGGLYKASAEEIVDFLIERFDRFWSSIPKFDLLAERYGDPRNDRLYRLSDVEVKWSRGYYSDHPFGVFPEMKTHLFWSLTPMASWTRPTPVEGSATCERRNWGVSQ